MHRIAALSVAALLAVAPVAPVASPAPAAAPEERGVLAQTRYQNEATLATNRHRLEHARVPLRGQACVQKFAVRQAKRMARQERMYHQRLGPILRECGLSLVGENVAYGYASGTAVVDDGWMHSRGHRRNILKPGYRLLGIGARQSDDGTWYAAQVFGRP